MRTTKEIEAEMGKLEAQREGIKVRLRELEAERNRAHYSEELAAMPAEKRAALILMAKSVESAEGFGKLGG